MLIPISDKSIFNSFVKSKKFKYLVNNKYYDQSKYMGLLLSKNLKKINFFFNEWFQKYITKFPHDFKYINTDIIRVSKEIIKSHPKSYYINIFKTIYDFNEESFFLDKAFYYLFAKDKIIYFKYLFS